MSDRIFKNLLAAQWQQGNFLCVGLDPDLEKIPKEFQKGNVVETLVAFNTAIIDATKDLVCAYKPNSAFYERYGADGIRALKDTIAVSRALAPEIPVILDAKRADLDNTNKGYVYSAFDELGADAITVHPYLGSEALEPFLSRQDKGVIVLCRTSNPGAKEFQDLDVGGEPLYMRVARTVQDTWNTRGNCGIVVGATYPEELKKIRSVVPDLPILIPGIGAQGGDLEKSVINGRDSQGGGIIISTSRAVIYAASVRESAQAFDSAIRKAV